MEVNYEEFSGSYASWGMQKSGDFSNLGRFSEEEEDNDGYFNYQMSKNDFVMGLPEDPFCMTLNTISDWLHEKNCHVPISVDYKLNGFERVSECEVSLPEDPFCMTLNSFSDWFHDVSESCDGGGESHDGFELVLAYLEMKDILAVEGVCRSLRDLVRKDPFFWRSIDLGGSPLRDIVNDESLLKLTRRAHGNLQCLNLGGCVGITDHGLMQVLASNPRLTKLSVSGCLRLSTEGVLSALRDLKSSNRLGVKSLITGGVLYFTKEQFKELNLLLGAHAIAVPKSRKQRFFTSCRLEFSLEDDRVTDLEICPRCEKPGLVFDCPGETCPLKDHPCLRSSCRACVVCIERCHSCGSCYNDCEHKPFWFAFSCVVCYKKISTQLQ
ncbi:hypothetical protein AALP_AA5G041500 [Arabis alpina]|uniref:F-box domain-containing protein n=1 Tax=Arabis alpina TaxID=50452 RepID=A0A087GUU7_ARAAL|nr:hypothetical protein AALP_AA5G041500 [Arabis alpina]